ncbi:MAG: hypothetical protein QXT07_02815, partial [Archaeoglobaceae archaeon]
MKFSETLALSLTVVSIATIIAVEFASSEIRPILLSIDFVVTIALILDFVSRCREHGGKYLLTNSYEIFAY